MASPQYRQGAAFENRVKDRFEGVGYYVIRSAGSQGVADLAAFDLMADRITHHPVPLMIQCKRGRNGLGVEAWNHFYAIADAAGALAIVAQKSEGRTLEADLWEITGSRTPRGRHKPWIPWPLRETDAPDVAPEPSLDDLRGALQADYSDLRVQPMASQKRNIVRDGAPSLCDCGHGRDEHYTACTSCLCIAFRAW